MGENYGGPTSRSKKKLSTGNKPKCSEFIQSNADRKARLPSRFGGLGHTSATLIAPIAFYSSYAHHGKLDKPKTKHLLAPEIKFCLEHIREKIPESSSELLELLPKSALDMWRKPPPPKIRRRLV